MQAQRQPRFETVTGDAMRTIRALGQAGFVVSGFELADYDSLMKGTSFGPVILPGDPLTSVLVMLIEGRADPAINMPHGDAKPLTQVQIATIRAWVEQGAKNN